MKEKKKKKRIGENLTGTLMKRSQKTKKINKKLKIPF